MKTISFTILSVVLILGTGSCPACLWDSETMTVEKARFPEALQIMTGNFPRHSMEFYRWRAANCQQALGKGGATSPVYDDLAVSQHKLGDHRAAIATMMEKEKLFPGLYETYSNLGTFYIYTGEPDEAVKWIDKALAINRDAHFGREKYQRWLVLWAQEPRPAQTEEAAMPDDGKDHHNKPAGFARFLKEQLKSDTNHWGEPERAAALKGILGMMRFADFDNPLLQEALGDVLLSGDWETNSMTNAAFAYRIAASKSVDAGEKQRLFSKFATATGVLGEKWNPKKVGLEVKSMLEKGKTLSETVRRDEIQWAKTRKDLSVEFIRKYFPKESGL
jgi:tetratricopeptide (TPR) repeat protein